MSQDLYHQQLLEYARNPSHKGKLSTFDLKCEALNSSCGDEVIFFLKLDENSDRIVQASWQGNGCIISQAAADQLTEKIIGAPVSQAKKIDLPKILDLLDLSEISPGRENCVTLGLSALSKL